jgi:hypothetical protein
VFFESFCKKNNCLLKRVLNAECGSGEDCYGDGKSGLKHTRSMRTVRFQHPVAGHSANWRAAQNFGKFVNVAFILKNCICFADFKYESSQKKALQILLIWLKP